MTVTFRRAARENVGLLIALAGPSGGGKTYSAMRLAAGIVGDGQRFAVIDTEARRALHYADKFAFDHAELGAPFRPQAYSDAIKAADAAGYKAIVIDSMSHEWAGEGGVTAWQEEELTRMAGDDWQKRERVKLAAWIKPKVAHKAMVQRLLQSRAHVIFCLRAEPKVEIAKGSDGKTQIIDKGYQPICAKDFMFEMTASFLLLPDKPGIGQPIKLQEQHRALFGGGQIGEAAGVALAAWARGGAAAASTSPGAAAPSAFIWIDRRGKPADLGSEDRWAAHILRGTEAIEDPDALLDALTRNAEPLAKLRAAGFADAVERVERAINARILALQGQTADA